MPITVQGCTLSISLFFSLPLQVLLNSTCSFLPIQGCRKRKQPFFRLLLHPVDTTSTQLIFLVYLHWYSYKFDEVMAFNTNVIRSHILLLRFWYQCALLDQLTKVDDNVIKGGMQANVIWRLVQFHLEQGQSIWQQIWFAWLKVGYKSIRTNTTFCFIEQRVV